MLEVFPKLNASLYYCPRKMPEMTDVKHELLRRRSANRRKDDGRLGMNMTFQFGWVDRGFRGARYLQRIRSGVRYLVFDILRFDWREHPELS